MAKENLVHLVEHHRKLRVLIVGRVFTAPLQLLQMLLIAFPVMQEDGVHKLVRCHPGHAKHATKANLVQLLERPLHRFAKNVNLAKTIPQILANARITQPL